MSQQLVDSDDVYATHQSFISGINQSSDKCATREYYLFFEVPFAFSGLNIHVDHAEFSSKVQSSAHDTFYQMGASVRFIGCLVRFDFLYNGFAKLCE
jgi:hypothetical protein